MLHALLHHKLDEAVPEPQRFEDALTSAVFGTLVMVDASETLSEWLSRARRPDGSCTATHRGPIGGVWFWPQLALAEPDVVLRIGNALFVIEAKYRSDRHDAPVSPLGTDDDEREADQLCRQWASLSADSALRARAPRELRSAIATCTKTLVFLVDGRRIRRARRQFHESARRLPDGSDLRLLTWQSLHEIITTGDWSAAASCWTQPLLEYLEQTGLYGFTGLAPCFQREQPNTRPVYKWRQAAALTTFDLRRSLVCGETDLRRLRTWSIAGSVHRYAVLEDAWPSSCICSVNLCVPVLRWTLGRAPATHQHWAVFTQRTQANVVPLLRFQYVEPGD